MECIVCQHQTKSYLHPKFKILFHECLNCHFIFKDIQHDLSLEASFLVYEKHQNSLDNQGYVEYLDNFIKKAIHPFQDQKGLKALDFGSGPGPVLAHLLTHAYGYQTDLYDIHYQPQKVYKNQKYDLITCTEVIEHIRNPHEVFKLFKKHLISDGILAMMTLFHPQNQQKLFDWFYIRDESHLSFYRPETMMYLAKLHGFKLVFHDNHRMLTFKHAQHHED